jgi:hypothetical protein
MLVFLVGPTKAPEAKATSKTDSSSKMDANERKQTQNGRKWTQAGASGRKQQAGALVGVEGKKS